MAPFGVLERGASPFAQQQRRPHALRAEGPADLPEEVRGAANSGRRSGAAKGARGEPSALGRLEGRVVLERSTTDVVWDLKHRRQRGRKVSRVNG